MPDEPLHALATPRTPNPAADPTAADPTAADPTAAGVPVSDEAVLSLAETIMAAFRLLKGDRDFRGNTATDLDPSLLPVLGVLSRGPARVGELADCLHGDMSTVSRQVSHLVDEGHASKVADPADRRVMQVSLTGRGRRALARVHAARAARLRELLHDWTPDEVDTLQRQLDRLAQAASSAADQGTSHGHGTSHGQGRHHDQARHADTALAG